MWGLYILFTIICCLFTYKFTCYQIIKLDRTKDKFIDLHQNYLCKALDEIAQIKNDVINIKKDIYQ